MRSRSQERVTQETNKELVAEGAVPSEFANPSASPRSTPMPARTLPTGTVIADKYEIIGLLGEGGMGVVYEAIQRPIDRPVALKLLVGSDRDTARERFEREAKAASKLQHPNTVTVYDYGHTKDGHSYLAMERLVGHTLGRELHLNGALDQGRSIRIFRQVAASVLHAHKSGVVHRDLKPDNVFLSTVGDTKDFVKVLDFGLARLTRGVENLTAAGAVFGTPRYMSPEQATGDTADERSDIYALGVILYEMLLGKVPFEAEQPVALLLMHVQTPPPRFRDVRPDLKLRPELEPIVTRALAKKPEHRFQSVGELLETIERYVLRKPTSGEHERSSTDNQLALSRASSTAHAAPRAASASSKPDAAKPPPMKPTGPRSQSTSKPAPSVEPGIVVRPDGSVEIVGPAPTPPKAAPGPPDRPEFATPRRDREEKIEIDHVRHAASRADRRPKGEVHVAPLDVRIIWKIAGVVLALVIFEALVGRGHIVELILQIIQ
ncbi:MAG: serine/threonine protein kinase [Deltaproteobacteria bacterium]|nr:serine/threonine protein kinase [Deltaproteobacteria bacterium]